jgi:hypothetical protein
MVTPKDDKDTTTPGPETPRDRGARPALEPRPEHEPVWKLGVDLRDCGSPTIEKEIAAAIEKETRGEAPPGDPAKRELARAIARAVLLVKAHPKGPARLEFARTKSDLQVQVVHSGGTATAALVVDLPSPEEMAKAAEEAAAAAEASKT